MVEHEGRWLFEEGLAYYHGLGFKKKDTESGQLVIEASASSGFPLAVAYCHYQGWKGMEKDEKKAFDMCVRIEQDTNGYCWVRFYLGVCYYYGFGTDRDYNKAIEWYTKSSEQGNSRAMNNLGYCCYYGQGCDQNMAKAFEWYEKSIRLGNSWAMCNVGACYHYGQGVTKDLNKAREWYTKAIAQGQPNAQKQLDRLNDVSIEIGILKLK